MADLLLGTSVLVAASLFLLFVKLVPPYLAAKVCRNTYEQSKEDDESTKATSVDQAWRELRAEGWISNAIAFIMMSVVLSALGQWHLLVPIDQRTLWKVPLTWVADAVRSSMSLVMQYLLNCHWFGMTTEDLGLIRRRRDTWTEGMETEKLLKKYGYFPVKIMDAVNRRGGHLVHYGIHVFIFSHSHTAQALLQTFFYLAIFRLTTHTILERDNYLGVIEYSGSRMRDGRCGRFNLLVVSVWGGFGKAIMVMLLMFKGYDKEENFHEFQAFAILALQGVIWGDTMGEVIGSFFGRLEFDVGGFGETNRKTVEGCAAVWLSTAISSWWVLHKWHIGEGAFEGHSMWPAICAVSTVATIMETAAPRGTDNFFIISGCVGCLFLFI